MLGDCELFVQLCENCNVPVPPEVLEQIKIGSTTGELRLSSMSIVVPICGILARVLASSLTIRKVDLGDCMLLSKGLSSILTALSEGSNVTSLNLKGNNISGQTVGQLGKIFHHNNTLKHLSLEWNSLGNDIDEFAKFCDGLGSNHNIEELDIRYNQISPYCAEPLAKALRINKCLKIVDLSWNTLGLRGGQLLLDAVRENRGLRRLNLRGNCIPEEIVHAIEEAIHKNQCASLVFQSKVSESCTKIVRFDEETKELKEKPLENVSASSEAFEFRAQTTPFREARDDQSEHENSVNQYKMAENGWGDVGETIKTHKNVDSTTKIIELNEILRERSAAIELLTTELENRSRDVQTSENLVKQLENEIKLLKEERECFSVEKSREIAELREIREKSDDHWQREYKKMEEKLRETSSREKELETRAQRYERDIRKISAEMTNLREKSLAQTRSYEDFIGKSRIELHRARRELKERENRHKIEINVLKKSLKESTEGLEDCQAHLQKSRLEVRDSSENLSSLKTRLSELERQNSRLLRIEESHERLKDEKKMMEEKSSDLRRTISTLERQITKLKGELIEPQRRYDLLKDELKEEKDKNDRLKMEVAEERTRHQEQNSQIQSLNAQITALNNQINEIQNNHIEAIRERDKERKALKDIISNKERDFNDLKTEEVQRASQLYAAFSKYYLGSMSPNTLL